MRKKFIENISGLTGILGTVLLLGALFGRVAFGLPLVFLGISIVLMTFNDTPHLRAKDANIKKFLINFIIGLCMLFGGMYLLVT